MAPETTAGGHYQTALDEAGNSEFLPLPGYGKSADIHKFRLTSITVLQE
jgi:hypothetical protein